MCFARGAVLNGKTDLELKVPIRQPYPRKHCGRCKQMMRAENIFPCVRILTLITPYPSPAAKSEEKRVFSQAKERILYDVSRLFRPCNNLMILYFCECSDLVKL